MAERKFITFSRPSEPNETKELSFFQTPKGGNLKAVDIYSKLGIDDKKEFLAISTPFFRKAIPITSVPLDGYPNLIQKRRPSKYLNPDYFFEIMPIQDKNKFTAFVNIEIKNKEVDIPPFEISFLEDQFKGKKYQELYELVEKSFPFGHTDGMLYYGKKEIQKNKVVKDLTKKLQKNNLKFVCNLDEKAQAKIRFRVNIITEIQTTEETYLRGLRVITNYWEPKMREHKLFNEMESSQVFHDFPVIINCHQQFLENLKERGAVFSAKLTDIFLDFAEFFKVSLIYISNYSNIIQLILEKSKQKDFVNKLQDLASNNPNEIKGDLQSFLITPVQRMPRYILFLRELIKATPNSHPDASMLRFASLKLEEVTSQIEKASTAAENNAKLLTIQNSFIEHFDVLKPSRIFYLTLQITIQKPKPGTGSIHLFNDLVLLTKEVKGGSRVILNQNPLTFNIVTKSSTQMSTMLFKKDDKATLCTFTVANQELQENFLKKLNEIKNENNQKDPGKLFKFELVQAQNVPSLYGHDSIYANNKVYTFGGKNDKDEFSSDIHIFNFNSNGNIEISSIPTTIPGRSGNTLTRVNNSIYIFGGNRNTEFFNDMWEFRAHDNEYIKLTTTNTPKPISGHSAVYVSDISKIFVFGGIDKKRKVRGKFYLFDIKSNNWEVIPSQENSPSPRVYHTCTLINQSLYVHGGLVNNKPSSDINVYDTISGKWTCPEIKGDKIIPRAMHRAIQIFHYIVFIGGTDSLHIAPPAILDTKEMKYTICNTGLENYIELSRFSMGILDKLLFVYGGHDFQTGKTYSSIYLVDCPEFLRFKTKRPPNIKPKTANTLNQIETINVVKTRQNGKRQRSNLLTPSENKAQLELLRKQLSEQSESEEKSKLKESSSTLSCQEEEVNESNSSDKKDNQKEDGKEQEEKNTAEQEEKNTTEQEEKNTTEKEESITENNQNIELRDISVGELTMSNENLAKPRVRAGKVRSRKINSMRFSSVIIENDFLDYNEDEFCKELNIDLSTQAEFQVIILKRKLFSLWRARKTNLKLQEEISERKTRNEDILYENEIYTKLIYKKKKYLAKIERESSIDEIRTTFENLIKNKISKLQIEFEGKKEEITSETLQKSISEYQKQLITHISLYASS